MLRVTLACAFVLAGAAYGQGVVTGELRYVDREFDFLDGFNGTETERPVPRALVHVLDASDESTLASGYTELDGGFAIPVVGSGPKDVLVRAFTISAPFGGNPVYVQDLSLNIYSTTSPVLSMPSLDQPFDAGVLVAPKVLGPGYQGGPFGILDQGVRAALYVMAQGEPGLPMRVDLFWPEPGGSFASGNAAHIQDDDGFDDIVVLHELGHVMQHLYSDSDSPGGSHSFSQSDQDPRLSMGEGWASFFAGAVRQHFGEPNPGFYMDCKGNGVTGPFSVQLKMRFEDGQPYANSTGGEADEGAVFCALWDLVDRADTNDGFAGDDDLVDGSFEIAPGLDLDAAQWAAFTGGEVLGTFSLHVVDLWDGYFVDAGAVRYDEMSSALDAWKIRVRPDGAEPNDSTSSAVPIALGDAWSETRTLYHATSGGPAPGNGDVDQWSFHLDADAVFEVETRYPGGNPDAETYADTLLSVFNPSGALLATGGDGGVGRNAKLSDLAAPISGTYRVAVRAESGSRPTGSYELRARQTGVLGPPQISGVTPSSVQTLQTTAQPTVIVSGTNLNGFTGVAIGGVPAAATLQPDGDLAVTLPLVDQVGALDLSVTSPLGTGSFPIDVHPPPAPLLNIQDGLSFWFSFTPLSFKLAAEPNDLAFLLFSLSGDPTPIPGIVDLGIGGGIGGIVEVKTVPLSGGGLHAFSLGIGTAPIGVDFHFQLAVLSAATGTLPLVTSNVVKGKKLN